MVTAEAVYLGCQRCHSHKGGLRGRREFGLVKRVGDATRRGRGEKTCRSRGAQSNPVSKEAAPSEVSPRPNRLRSVARAAAARANIQGVRQFLPVFQRPSEKTSISRARLASRGYLWTITNEIAMIDMRRRRGIGGARRRSPGAASNRHSLSPPGNWRYQVSRNCRSDSAPARKPAWHVPRRGNRYIRWRPALARLSPRRRNALPPAPVGHATVVFAPTRTFHSSLAAER